MLERKKYRQRWKPGSILQIDLDDGSFGYGQVLENTVAFLNHITHGELVQDFGHIIKKPLIFKICVMKHCVTQDWKIIGKHEIDPEINKLENNFSYDPIIVHDTFVEK